MKKISLLLIFCCSLLTGHAQDSISTYLERVKTDFRSAERIIPDRICTDYDLVLVGESHGFEANYEIAFKLIQEYKAQTNFKYLLGEMDWASAQVINKCLLAEDTVGIKQLIGETKTSPSWCRERYDFYTKLMALNRQYTTKIQYLGVDITAGGIAPAVKRLLTIMNKYADHDSVLVSVSDARKMDQETLGYITRLYEQSSEKAYGIADRFEYQYHLNNMLNYHKAIQTTSVLAWDAIRDSCMFENYKQLEQHFQLREEKMIGVFWGHTHAYQSASEDVSWFASRLKEDLNKKIYSYRIFYFDSESMLPASWIPGVLKVFKSKKKLYYNSELQNDDKWVTGTKPKVGSLKEATTPHSIVYFDLEANGSPFKRQPYLVINDYYDWVTTDYYQAAIVVTNSVATEPFGPNRR